MKDKLKVKIQKGVSPQEPKSGVSALGDLSMMQVGDSIMVDTIREVNDFRTYWYIRGHKVVQRIQKDGRFRVWKGEKR